MKNFIDNKDSLFLNTLPSEYIITADNIEAIGNHGLSEKILSQIYKDFFVKYVEKYPLGPKSIMIKSDLIQVWSMHNKISISNNSIHNTSIPVLPNSYTDNYWSTTNVLNLNTEKIISHKEIKKVSGVFPLWLEDIWSVSSLERESYEWFWWSLWYPLMRGEIIWSLINQTYTWRPNLSFVAYRENTLLWYLLAYESTHSVYISDRNCKNQIAAIRLLEQFWISLNQVDVCKPLIMRSRDSTSLWIIRKLIRKKWRTILSEKDDSIWSEKFTRITIQRGVL